MNRKSERLSGQRSTDDKITEQDILEMEQAAKDAEKKSVEEQQKLKLLKDAELLTLSKMEEEEKVKKALQKRYQDAKKRLDEAKRREEKAKKDYRKSQKNIMSMETDDRSSEYGAITEEDVIQTEKAAVNAEKQARKDEDILKASKKAELFAKTKMETEEKNRKAEKEALEKRLQSAQKRFEEAKSRQEEAEKICQESQAMIEDIEMIRAKEREAAEAEIIAKNAEKCATDFRQKEWAAQKSLHQAGPSTFNNLKSYETENEKKLKQEVKLKSMVYGSSVPYFKRGGFGPGRGGRGGRGGQGGYGVGRSADIFYPR